MSKIHYFARFAAKENFATNNTMLLLSKLYERNPLLLDQLLYSIFEKANTKPQVATSFEQQSAKTRLKDKRNSIPDGSIYQLGFRLLIETKLHGNFDFEQILAHCNHFQDNEQRYLLLIDPEQFDASTIQSQLLSNGHEVHIASITFESLIGNIRDIIKKNAPYDTALEDIIEDYEDFCVDTNILSLEKYLLRLRTSGDTLNINLKFNTYYELRDPKSRRYSFFGLYDDRKIKAVGKVRNIVEADFIDGNLIELSSTSPVTSSDRANIIGIIEASMIGVKDSWTVYHNHRFIVVDSFIPTDYQMNVTSKHSALRKDKYIDLREVFETNNLPAIDKIAATFRGKKW